MFAHMLCTHMLVSLLSVILFVYACHSIRVCISPILELLRLYTCSHAYSDISVIVTQPNSINSYPVDLVV
jgi:hypothetical protein